MLNACSRMGLLSLSLVCLVPVTWAQDPSTRSAEGEVLAVVDRFFSCLSARDSAGMAALLEPAGVLHGVEVGPDARPPMVITHSDYLVSLGKGKAALRERYWEPKVQVDGAVATVWAAYDFHVDGAFSHCGHDVFTLVRRSEGWRIAGGVFSMQREGCPASPLGPVMR